ncbi:hypothetical protein P3T22_006138 [Paraburkholderia sp. GAS348]
MTRVGGCLASGALSHGEPTPGTNSMKDSYSSEVDCGHRYFSLRRTL